MNLFFLTLFPEQLAQYLKKGIFEKKEAEGYFSASFVNIRDFADPPHYKVDDHPYSKRQGMLLKVDVLKRAIESIPNGQDYPILYMCPKGPVFTQRMSTEFATQKGIIFLSGYYEGVDERIFDCFPIQRVSLGDFILSSGDSAALTMAESILRLIPGVIGKSASVQEDSIINDRLEHPHYTSPVSYAGYEVPEVLRSGNHQKVVDWQENLSYRFTLLKKPGIFLNSRTPDLEIRCRLNRVVKEICDEQINRRV